MKAKRYGRGQILKIDLTTRSTSVEPIPEGLTRRYLGGEGINSRLLWEHFLKVDPRIDPLSPENILIAGIGPLGATGYGGGTKMKWTFKSPLTRIFGDSSSGGTLGANLRWAGYDHLVITGRAEHPVYLWVNDDQVQIRDARHLGGMGVPEADRAIKEELGFPDAETACIGPAGENLVAFANLQVSTHRAAGRAGIGCVLGAKNLKAIAARGTRGIPIYDPQRFLKAIDTFTAALFKPQRLRDAWKSVGTLGVFGYYNRMGFSPYRNSQRPMVPPENFEKLSSHWYTQNLGVRGLSCSPGCISGCSGIFRTRGDESPFAQEYGAESGYRMELAGQIGWGGVCDIPDLPAIAHLWRICCAYGLDVIELCLCCGFLMELWERGIITQSDTAEWFGEQVSLEWGNYRAVAKIMESIALQRNVLGQIFKDGLYKAAQRIEEIKGVPALKFAVYGKGGASFIAEIRGNSSWATALAVASRGCDHLKGAVATVERFNRPDVSQHEFGSPDAAQPLTPTLKGRDTARAEARCALINSLGICSFLVAVDSILYPLDLFAEALLAITGEEINPQELLSAGQRTVNIEKAFNSRLGLRREDDRLCERWMKEPLTEGAAKGMTAGDFLELTKDEYYESQGWDKKTSLQTRARLEELGMADVAEVLAKERALAP